MSLKRSLLYHIFCVTFGTLVVMANILSAKMVTLPGMALTFPVGLIFYPLTFLVSDLTTELFGVKEPKEWCCSLSA